MQVRIRRLIAVVCSGFVLFTAGVAVGEKATDLEIAQLPTFCWEQMGSKVAKGAQFRIPTKSCGVGMNHYCPGLVDLIRARNETNKSRQLGKLGVAETKVRYTLKWIEGKPNCPIRGHVEATLAEIGRMKDSAKAAK